MNSDSDSRLEETIGRVLQIGVTTSSACLALGLVFTFWSGDAQLANILFTTGLIILMATPVARVMISFGEYLIERDWFFVVLTSIVLLELAGSVVAAFR